MLRARYVISRRLGRLRKESRNGYSWVPRGLHQSMAPRDGDTWARAMKYKIARVVTTTKITTQLEALIGPCSSRSERDIAVFQRTKSPRIRDAAD